MGLRLRQPPRKVLYLVLVAVLASWAVFFSIRWANRQLQTSAVHTSAVLYEVSSDLQNLPTPDFIKPGQTSGNAAGVITKYQQVAKELRGTKHKLGTPLLPRLVVFWRFGQLAANQKQAGKTLDAAANTLDQTTKALQTSKQFIEYAPLADLAGLGTGGDNAGERLQRIKDGMNKLGNDLPATGYLYAESLAAKLPPLADAAPSLTPNTLPAWAKQVDVVQSAFVATFQKSWQAYLHDTAAQLNQEATL